MLHNVSNIVEIPGCMTPVLKKRIAESDEVLIIDGCPATCGAKITVVQGVTPAHHIVITGLGIDKVYTKDYTEEEVVTVISAAWEGRGRPEVVSNAR
jgi:uncharacterized metal-binding protein